MACVTLSLGARYLQGQVTVQEEIVTFFDKTEYAIWFCGLLIMIFIFIPKDRKTWRSLCSRQEYLNKKSPYIWANTVYASISLWHFLCKPYCHNVTVTILCTVYYVLHAFLWNDYAKAIHGSHLGWKTIQPGM
jgi:hypothetical protein